jgi:hypothetical protein
MVFENKVLRRIFAAKMDEVTGEWKKLHSEELHNLYSSQISLGRSSQGELGGQGMWHGWERRESVQGFSGKGRRPRGRPRRSWEDGIRMNVREIGRGWIGFDWLRIGTSGGLL